MSVAILSGITTAYVLEEDLWVGKPESRLLRAVTTQTPRPLPGGECWICSGFDPEAVNPIGRWRGKGEGGDRI